MFKVMIFLMAITACKSVSAVESNKPLSKLINYKTVNNSQLKMRIYYPPHWVRGRKKLPAAVFFFGGGWLKGSFYHLNKQAKHLAMRGMIAVCPQYRTKKSHGITPDKCLEDAKGAMRYIYSNADKLGIDKTRIAAGGASAGGHLAAATAFCKGFNAPDDDLKVNCKPVALILFSPVIDNSEKGYGYKRVKAFWKNFSPLHNISKNSMPVLFMMGDKDKLLPLSTGKAFKKKIEENGGRCELIIYREVGHSILRKYPKKIMNDMDKFMVGLGFITSSPKR